MIMNEINSMWMFQRCIWKSYLATATDQYRPLGRRESRVRLHPSSTLADAPKSARTTAAQAHRSAVEALPADWLMFEELSRSGRVAHVRCCTLVSPITVALMAGPARLSLDAVSEADAGRW